MKYKKIIQRKDNTYYWKEGDFHSNQGLIKEKDIKTKSKAISNTDKEFVIYNAKFIDNLKKIRRGPQAIPFKDIGRIIIETGINKDSKIVDAGTGSGMLVASLANIAKQVTTYEKREDFMKIAEKNFKNLELKNIKIKNKDIYDGISEKNIDLITLDLDSPWLVIEHAEKALVSGGFLVSYSPSIPQVQDFIKKIEETESLQVSKVMEIIERPWKFEGRKIHPEYRMLGHSGFLVFIRKIQ